MPGWVLDELKILYKNKKVAQVRFGSWNITNVKFNTIGTLNSWLYLIISLPTHYDAYTTPASLAAAVKQFIKTLAKTGIFITAPLQGQRLELDNPKNARLNQRFKSAAGKLELLLVILPKPLYRFTTVLSTAATLNTAYIPCAWSATIL